MTPVSNTRSKRPILIAAAAAGCVLAAGIRLRPAHSASTRGDDAAATTREVSVAAAAPKAVDYPFRRYEGLLHHNPFESKLPRKDDDTAAVHTAPVLPDAGAAKKADTGAKPAAAATAKPPEPPDPLKDWTYTGTVVIGPDVYAVLENRAAKRSQYVKAGGSFDAGSVQTIGQDALVLTVDGKPRSLPKSTAFNATPLSQPGGPGGAPAGGPGHPGQGPGSPGGPPGPPGGPGMPPQNGPPPGAVLAVPVSAAMEMERATLEFRKQSK